MDLKLLVLWAITGGGLSAVIMMIIWLPDPPPPPEIEPPLPPHAVTPIKREQRKSRKSACRVADFTISSRMFGSMQ